MGPDPTANYVNGDGDAMTYAVPAGLAILGYSLSLDAYGGPCGIQSGQCANGFGDVFVNHTGQSDPNYDYRNLGYGRQEPMVSVGELSGVDSVSVGVGCDPGQDLNDECPASSAGGAEAQGLVSAGSFTLLDSTVPTVADVTGSLLAAGTLTGLDTVNFTASDSGGGVYSASVLVDGRQVAGEVPDTNAGLCVNLASASSATMAFASPQPCPATENVSLTVNTSAIAAGQHHLQVLVTDAAGDEAVAYDGTITTAGLLSTGAAGTGGPIGPGSPLALRGAANGANASDQAKLTARWQGTSKATRTSRYGQPDRVTGRLTTSTGQAISGALLDVTTTAADQGARAASLASVRTGPTGAWTLTLPRSVASSTVRVDYRSHVNDTIPVATATLTLRVHAGIALRIAPRVTSVGHTIVFSGSLHGGPCRRVVSSSCSRPARVGNGSSSARSHRREGPLPRELSLQVPRPRHLPFPRLCRPTKRTSRTCRARRTCSRCSSADRADRLCRAVSRLRVSPDGNRLTFCVWGATLVGSLVSRGGCRAKT